MRLFISIEPTPEVEKHLFTLQKQLQNAKLTLTKSFHLTLKFLGEVSPENAEKIKKQLETISFKEFTARLSVTGVFPNENYIRVVWVGVEPQDVIKELQAKIDEVLKGMFPKEKDFRPHLTLARVKSVENKEVFAKHVKNLKVDSLTFSVNKFKLIESQLQAEGPIYKDLAIYSSG